MIAFAGVAELADAQDLKSCGRWLPYRFDSGFRHQKNNTQFACYFFVFVSFGAQHHYEQSEYIIWPTGQHHSALADTKWCYFCEINDVVSSKQTMLHLWCKWCDASHQCFGNFVYAKYFIFILHPFCTWNPKNDSFCMKAVVSFCPKYLTSFLLTQNCWMFRLYVV